MGEEREGSGAVRHPESVYHRDYLCFRYYSCLLPFCTFVPAKVGPYGLVTQVRVSSVTGFTPISLGCHPTISVFPLFSLTLKIASKVTLDPLQLVRVKLARVECLAEAGFPAEAASALAGVLSGKGTPKTTGGYAGRR